MRLFVLGLTQFGDRFFWDRFRPCPYARFSKPPVPDSNRDDAVDRGQNWLRAMFK
jgi:hypothetical protein